MGLLYTFYSCLPLSDSIKAAFCILSNIRLAVLAHMAFIPVTRIKLSCLEALAHFLLLLTFYHLFDRSIRPHFWRSIHYVYIVLVFQKVMLLEYFQPARLIIYTIQFCQACNFNS